jgi:hypothetical protein
LPVAHDDPGVGLLTATALVAAVGTDVSLFHDARRFSCWFGITPKEQSSGAKMSDIRLQALPQANNIDQALAIGGESIYDLLDVTVTRLHCHACFPSAAAL